MRRLDAARDGCDCAPVHDVSAAPLPSIAIAHASQATGAKQIDIVTCPNEMVRFGVFSPC